MPDPGDCFIATKLISNVKPRSRIEYPGSKENRTNGLAELTNAKDP